MNALLNRVDGMLDSIVFGVKLTDLFEKYTVYGFHPTRKSKELFNKTFSIPLHLSFGGYVIYDTKNETCKLAVGDIKQLFLYGCVSRPLEIQEFISVFPNDRKIYTLTVSGNSANIRLSHPGQSDFIEFDATHSI